mmetsp:Transcript_46353/g.83841  ORF Transcript_46353/g.83841 Transcript_46353/m.83841 type:complete len:272 (+) Transcript_46353:2325-3140(+)
MCHDTGILKEAPRMTVCATFVHAWFMAKTNPLGVSSPHTVSSSSSAFISIKRFSIHFSMASAAGVICTSLTALSILKMLSCMMKADMQDVTPVDSCLKESWSVRRRTTSPGYVVISDGLASSSYGCSSRVPLSGPRNTRIATLRRRKIDDHLSASKSVSSISSPVSPDWCMNAVLRLVPSKPRLSWQRMTDLDKDHIIKSIFLNSSPSGAIASSVKLVISISAICAEPSGPRRPSWTKEFGTFSLPSPSRSRISSLAFCMLASSTASPMQQ